MRNGTNGRNNVSIYINFPPQEKKNGEELWRINDKKNGTQLNGKTNSRQFLIGVKKLEKLQK